MITHCQPVRILSRSPSCAIRAALTAMLVLAALAAAAQAQDTILLEGSVSAQNYILQLSGTVLNERFNGATMTLKLGIAGPGGPNRYQVIAVGFPDAQTRNTFFWNSDLSSMDVSSNTLTCKIKPSAPTGIHFYYISPAGLKRPQVTHRDKEDDKRALKTAVPTMVPVKAGELKLTINPNSVSGTVWLQGYDTVEKSYVRYSASFSGMRMTHVEQKTQRTHR